VDHVVCGVCPLGGCMASLQVWQQAVLVALHAQLISVLVAMAPQRGVVDAHPLLLQLQSASADQFVFVLVAMSTRKPPIDAVLADLDVKEGLSATALPFTLVLGWAEGADLRFINDTAFCARLAEVAADWVFSTLQCGAVESLSEFQIVAREEVDFDQIRREQEAQRQAVAALRAMRQMELAARRAAQPTDRRRGRTVRARGTAEVVDPGPEGDATPVLASSDDSTEAEHAEMGEVASDVEPPTLRGPRHARAEGWGAFTIARVFLGGRQVGWGATCGLHHDRGGSAHLQCKKQVRSLALSDDELVLRLKRWLVAGFHDEGWHPHTQRTRHVAMGGVSLAEFSEGLSLAELDAEVQHAS
jgi:hypothetical protein